jgi:hypothetical protein
MHSLPTRAPCLPADMDDIRVRRLNGDLVEDAFVSSATSLVKVNAFLKDRGHLEFAELYAQGLRRACGLLGLAGSHVCSWTLALFFSPEWSQLGKSQ